MTVTNRCDMCGALAVLSIEHRRDWYKIKRDNWGCTFDVCPECADACGISQAFAKVEAGYMAAWEEIAAQTKDGE